MATARFIVGDVRESLAGLPDASVDLVFTSPPFLRLRSYLEADHPDKALEIGAEATPGEYLDTLLDVVEECARVLAPHGSLVWELGDTYAGSGGAGGDYNDGGLRDGQERFDGTAAKAKNHRFNQPDGPRRTNDRWKGERDGWPLDRSMCLVPQLFALALAYGFNPLTGRETDRWRIRNVVAWCRPNPPVGELGDKFRPGVSYLTVACKDRRYFDLDSVRHFNPRAAEFSRTRAQMNRGAPAYHTAADETNAAQNGAGAPPLDWWVIPGASYTGAHYAVMAPEVVVAPVKAMSPERVCTVCGRPSERITESVVLVDGQPVEDPSLYATRFGGARLDDGAGRTEKYKAGKSLTGIDNNRVTAGFNTIGWTDCDCRCGACGECEELERSGLEVGYCTGKWRRGLVLDPFVGSGTTLVVATGHGRDAIGLDLDGRNAELARERLGMFLEVDDAQVR